MLVFGVWCCLFVEVVVSCFEEEELNLTRANTGSQQFHKVLCLAAFSVNVDYQYEKDDRRKNGN
jgi:hypothetical protein